MKIFTVITGFSLFILLNFSCKDYNVYVNDKFADTIVIDVKHIKDEVALSELFSKVEFVPLETNDNCITGRQKNSYEIKFIKKNNSGLWRIGIHGGVEFASRAQ
ncbi:MAG: 6-bladed beta-propeller [Tannerella sp.]|jgi:hypothetical protein|nr:6-bladed beta-propeller [Tannerella sp.]